MNFELNFIEDKEKMKDFFELTKEEFLFSYSYLSEEEYDVTKYIVDNLNYLVIKEGYGHYMDNRYEVWDISRSYPSLVYHSDLESCKEYVNKYNLTVNKYKNRKLDLIF